MENFINVLNDEAGAQMTICKVETNEVGGRGGRAAAPQIFLK